MKYLFVIAFAASCLLSCKKKDAAPVSGTATTSTTGGINNTSTYGSLQTLVLQTYYGQAFGGLDSVTIATFNSSLSPAPVYVSAGTVTFNNTALKYYPNNHNYQDTTDLVNIHGSCTWQVAGSADIPAFTYSYTPVYPVFTGNAQLPDSVSLASGCTFNIAGVSHVDNGAILVEFFQGSNFITKQIPAGQASCHFSVGELSVFQAGTDATLLLLFSNSSTQAFGGKEFSFQPSLEHIKYQVKIKP